MAMMRLDRFIAENSALLRKDAKSAIKRGRVFVNGVIEKDMERKVSDSDEVCLDGKAVKPLGMVYLMMHKPAGVVSATQDNHDKTVLDLLSEQEDMEELAKKAELFPIGRLDKDTEGMLLLTNDGELSHRLLSPKRHVEKVYYAKLSGKPPENAAERFQAGLAVGKDYVAMPAGFQILSAEAESAEVRITLQEGKFHQVKRMCHEIGCEVTYLKRIAMGALCLDETLPLGKTRYLTEQEIKQLKDEV